MTKEIETNHSIFTGVDETSRRSVQNYIAELELYALKNGSPVEIPTEHFFSKGVYAREMRMPAGAVVVGKIHRHENLNIISEGTFSVLSIDGLWERKTAPFTFVGSQGAKRVIVAHTPVTWTTIHGTDEKDIDKIEAQFIAEKYSDIVPLQGGKVCLG